MLSLRLPHPCWPCFGYQEFLLQLGRLSSASHCRLLLLGQLKSLFNEEFLGHTRGWVTVYSAVKVASLWGLAQRLIPSR